METEKKYIELATFIVDKVGGVNNIKSLVHCVTRLRFQLKNTNIVNREALKQKDGVITIVESGGQFQVVIGNAVAEVYKAIITTTGRDFGENTNEKKARKPLDAFVDTVSSIFTPILGLLCAGGMIKGFNALFVAFGWIQIGSGTHTILQAAGDGIFYFFPIFLGYTSAKKFGLNQFLGMAIGASLVYPSLAMLTKAEPLYILFASTPFESPVYATFLGVPIILMTYSSSVIPIIVATYFGAKIEKGITKVVPQVLKMFAVPAITLLLSIPLTFLLIGPIATWAGHLLGNLTMTIYNVSPVLCGLFVGGLWQVFVMFGLHWGFIPIGLNNMAVMGYDSVLALIVGTPLATAGVVLAIFLKTKNSRLKTIAFPAFISSLFGVSEPSIYGVTLPRKKPFFITLFSASIAGGIMGLFGTKSYMMGGMGILAVPNYINPKTGIEMGFYGMILAILVAFVLGFVLTWLFGFSDKNEQREIVTSSSEEAIFQEILHASAKGEIVQLSEVKDKMFSSEVMGQGIAIVPEEGKVYAPISGVITSVFPTGHAITMLSEKGAEILIHIGIDTVKLEGKYFNTFVKQGNRVQIGTLLAEFNINEITKLGYDVSVLVIVTNSDKYLKVIPSINKKVNIEDEVISLGV